MYDRVWWRMVVGGDEKMCRESDARLCLQHCLNNQRQYFDGMTTWGLD